ncbi:MAG: pentapeptide repeat-containing protein [bacterium]
MHDPKLKYRKENKLTFVLRSILFFILLSFLSQYAGYAESPSDQDVISQIFPAQIKGRLSKGKLREILSNGGTVSGYVVPAKDLIDLIADDSFQKEIKISDSVVEGTLDFTSLKPVSSASLEGHPIKQWLAEREFQKCFVVKNQISMNNVTFVHRWEESKDNRNSRYESIRATKWSLQEPIVFKNQVTPTVFLKPLNFDGEVFFFGTVNIEHSAFLKRVAFRGVNFFGQVSLKGSQFFDRVDFIGDTFSEEADFTAAIFNRLANFDRSTFIRNANFSKAVFNDAVNFRSTVFFRQLLIEPAGCHKYVDFRDTRIRTLAFQNLPSQTIAPGSFDFKGAYITEALLENITFQQVVDFSGVQFGRLVNDETRPPCQTDERAEAISSTFFRFVTFESDAYFLGTQFTRDVAFERVYFRRSANFTDASFQRGKDAERKWFSISYVYFDDLLIKWDQLPDPIFWVTGRDQRIKTFKEAEAERKKGKRREGTGTEAGEGLEALSQVIKRFEENFRRQGRLSDANKAYYHMKNAELREEREAHNFWWWFPRQILWRFWGLTCGYGTKIVRILCWLVGIDLLFSLLFLRGKLARQPHPETKPDYRFKLRLFECPKCYLTHAGCLDRRNERTKFLDALAFSTVVLLKIGYRDTTISGKILGRDCKWFVRIEWTLGFLLLIFLLITLSNRVPLVAELMRGML